MPVSAESVTGGKSGAPPLGQMCSTPWSSSTSVCVAPRHALDLVHQRAGKILAGDLRAHSVILEGEARLLRQPPDDARHVLRARVRVGRRGLDALQEAARRIHHERYLGAAAEVRHRRVDRAHEDRVEQPALCTVHIAGSDGHLVAVDGETREAARRERPHVGQLHAINPQRQRGQREAAAVVCEADLHAMGRQIEDLRAVGKRRLRECESHVDAALRERHGAAPRTR